MEPKEFENCNIIFGKDQDEFQDLPAMITKKGRESIQFWEFSEEEIKDIVSGKKKGVFVSQLIGGAKLQPILLSLDNLSEGKIPYTFPKKEETK